jgi:hypothetical protein
MKKIIRLTESDLTNIVKRVIKESAVKDSLIDMIKDEGWESAVELVGGRVNLKKLVGIESPIDFLNLFNDLDVIDSEENPNLTLFRYEIGNNLMVHDDEFDFVYINYGKIWSFLEKVFGLNYSEIQELTQEWLGEVYDLKGVYTSWKARSMFLWLGEVYDLKGVTTTLRGGAVGGSLSEAYKKN